MSAFNEPFRVEHHALLFAWFARAIILEAGPERGEELLSTAVRLYGNQRGKRMAMRAAANGHRRIFWNYLVYQEWEAPAGQVRKKINVLSPHLNARFVLCPWVEIWRENNLMEFGRHMCRGVDAALFQGFNPDIVMELRSNRADGAPFCDFHFPKEKLSLISAVTSLIRRKMLHKNIVMPWEYHTGHVFKAMSDVIARGLGNQGMAVIQSTLDTFEERFGAEARKTLTTYQYVDFDKIPDGHA